MRASSADATAPSVVDRARCRQWRLGGGWQAAEADDFVSHLARFLCELSVAHYSMLSFLPSEIAAASVLLARKEADRTPWTPTLRHYTRHTAAELAGCVAAISALHTALDAGEAGKAATTALRAVKQKYSTAAHLHVGMLPSLQSA